MTDRHGRTIHYLRISVTDRCNLRCRYCMPEEGVAPYPHEAILRYDEICRLTRILAGLGINRVRLTGGEPLVRKDLPDLARELRRIPGISFLGLTTNGLRLDTEAEALYRAGVDGLNISLDTTDPARYTALTRRDCFSQAMAGIEAALALPFSSVKLNCVLSPHSLPADWLGVVGLARDRAVDVRLIEWMPLAAGDGGAAAPADTALDAISQAYGPMTPLPAGGPGGPASYWSIPGFQGRVGLIPAMSNCFCESCNRVRLTSTGELKLCLFYDTGIPLAPLLRGGAGDREITEAIAAAIAHKPRQHAGRPLVHPDALEEAAGIPPAIQRTHAQGMYRTGG